MDLPVCETTDKLALREVSSLRLKCGELSLKCVAKRQNQKIYDEERRSVGPKIDMIFFHKHYHQEISLLEVSGPLEKINHAHYLEDRHKIAKGRKSPRSETKG